MSLRVAINAQLQPGTGAGGIETVLLGLVHALGQLHGPEKYVVVGPWEDPDWLKPYVGENQVITRGPEPQAVRPTVSRFKSLAKSALSMLGIHYSRRPLAKSGGFYEGLGCQVVHFPYQHFIVSTLPAIFNPHDLQHVHYPQFFSPADVTSREVSYGAACRAANTVAVSSRWVKQDIVQHYRIPPEKIQVISWAPPTRAYGEPTEDLLKEVNRFYGLPGEFALYPAMTWQHKNHIRLIEALASLRDSRGIRINLICTGHQNDFFSTIRNRMTELQINDRVRFLGMVPPEHLRALYRLSRFMVFPSLFEAAGGPLVEAWTEGTPVTCSAVTSIPEQAGDAALLFDPTSVDAIASALEKMSRDASLRETLVKRGFVRLKNFTWKNTAKAYRAAYRRAAGNDLTDEDRYILAGGQN